MEASHDAVVADLAEALVLGALLDSRIDLGHRHELQRRRRLALWHARCPDDPEFAGTLPDPLAAARTSHWFDPCELLLPNARSELLEQFRERQCGGGWLPRKSVAQSQCERSGETTLLVYHRPILDGLREPSVGDPWRVLVSGCLAGWRCGVDGTDYGLPVTLESLMVLPTFRALPFCPEQHALGTPRTLPDIHGGDGVDVVLGRAKVFDENGVDLTEKMLEGARAMVAFARKTCAELAILTDMSAACGSQVISDGCRLVEERRYQKGVGVATALLLDAGIAVVSQRDFHTLALLRARLDPGFEPPAEARDHHDHSWTVEHLPKRHPRG